MSNKSKLEHIEYLRNGIIRITGLRSTRSVNYLLGDNVKKRYNVDVIGYDSEYGGITIMLFPPKKTRKVSGWEMFESDFKEALMSRAI